MAFGAKISISTRGQVTDLTASDSDYDYAEDEWAFVSDGEDTPSEELYRWKRPDTEELVRKLKGLIKDYPDGLLFKDFLQAYFKKYHQELDIRVYAHTNLKSFVMGYSDVLDYVREGTDPNGWLIIGAEEEEINQSMRINHELIEEFKGNIGRTVVHYISQKNHEFRLGMPIDRLQNHYEELYECIFNFEFFGFETLESFCLANEGTHYHIYSLDGRYVILPPSQAWRCPEPRRQEPLSLGLSLPLCEPEGERPSIPKDMAGPDATYFEIDYKRYLKPGDRVQIKISKYVDPLNFYFVLRAFDSVREDFLKGLQTFYNSNHDLQIPIALIRPGQCCVVYFSNSDSHQYRSGKFQWGRARVIELINDELAKVMIVDIGKSVVVRVNLVRFLAKQFMSFPVQIIPGMLAGVAPKNETVERFDQDSMQLFCEYSALPTLDAKIHDPDFNTPIFPVIIFAFDSKQSLNKILIETFRNKHLPRVPYCILIRKFPDDEESHRRYRDEIHPFYENRGTFNDCEQYDSRRERRDSIGFERTPRNDFSIFQEFDRRRYGPTNPPAGSQSELCLNSSPARRRAPVYQYRAQPSATQPMTSPASDPAESNEPESPPASSSSDSDVDTPKSKFLNLLNGELIDKLYLTPIQIPKLNHEEAQENSQINGCSMDKGNKQTQEEIQSSERDKKEEARCQNPVGGAFSGDIKKAKEQEPAEKLIKAQAKSQKDVNMQQSKASPSLRDETKSSRPGRKDRTSKPKENSRYGCPNSDLLCAPSTSKQATAAEALASSQNRNSKKSKAQKESKPKFKDESKSDMDTDIESDFDSDTITDFIGKTDPNTKSETESEYSSDTSDDSENLSESDSLYNKGDAREEDLYENEQEELNRCIMSFLSSNSIIRDIGLINPQRALDVAKIWAQLSRFSKTPTLFSSRDFNPFEVYPKSQRQSSIFRLLTESLPQEVFWKWAEYSDSVDSEEPEFEQKRMNKCQEYPVKADYLNIIKSKSMLVKPREAAIIIQKLDIKQKRRYRVTIENWVYKCTRNDLKIFHKMKIFKGLEKFLQRGKFHIKWHVTKKKQDLLLKEFERTFSLYIASRKHLVNVGDNMIFQTK